MSAMDDEQQTGRLPFPPVVVGIAGASGSGKTTLAVELARELSGIHFPIDHYYRDLSHLPMRERVLENFDDPEMIESKRLASDVAALARGEAIDRPVYDFSTHTRVPFRTETLQTRTAVLVEGLFALYFEGLLPSYSLSIYVEAPDDVCFQRRLRRDMEERGRTAESVMNQYDAMVRPAFEKYVQPSAANADLTVDGSSALDWKVEQVLAEMRKRGLLRLRSW
jgi:uridine kinase